MKPSLSLALFSLSGPIVAGGQVWIVDAAAAPGSHFTEIAPAVAAAADGDTIVVRPGPGNAYGDFTVDGKGLTILSADPAVRFELASGHSGVEVRNLAAGQSLVLRGGDLAKPKPGSSGLLVQNCAGTVWLEDLRLCGDEYASLRVVESSRVVVVRITANECAGSKDWADGAGEEHGLHAVSSNVYVYSSTLLGLEGQSVSGTMWPMPGDAGAVVDGGFLYLSGTTVEGGEGGAVLPSAPCIWSFGGSGGHGLLVKGDGVVHRQATSILSGKGGTSWCTELKGADGVPVVIETGTVDELPGNAHGMELTAPLSEGAPLSATVLGDPGEIAFLVIASQPAPLYVPPLFGPLLPAQPWILVPLAPLPESGSLSIQAVAGTLPPGVGASTLFVQPLLVDPAGLGIGFLGAAATLTVVDGCAPLTAAQDCNGNGIGDACDIASGASGDCDGNGVPDECQPQTDCNGNGIPDFCDIALGTSLDLDGNGVPDECQSVIYVPADQPTLQAAIDAANTGDTVVVQDGVHSGPGNVNVLLSGKEIVLRSENGPAACVFDAQGAPTTILRIDSIDGPHLRVEGLTFRGVEAQGSFAPAMHVGNARVTIVDCAFLDNASDECGGINALGAHVVVRDCKFTNNRSEWWGGAVRAGGGSLTVEGCEFDRNVAYSGGAIHSTECDVTIERCIFLGNRAKAGSSWVGSDGGAVYATGGTVLVRNSMLAGNSADHNGGALRLHSIEMRVELSSFAGNLALQDGGALALFGMWPTKAATLEGCVLWDNAAVGNGDQIHVGAALVDISYSDVQGGAAGIHAPGTFSVVTLEPGVFDADPLFVNAAAGDLHLGPGSPCVDAGNPAFVPAPGETDIDGDPRVLGAAVDVGADERE